MLCRRIQSKPHREQTSVSTSQLIYYSEEVAVYFKSHKKYYNKLRDGKRFSLTLQHVVLYVISNLSNDRSKTSSKTIPPHSAI